MNIKSLRKIYPTIKDCHKNISWRRITDAELEKSLSEKQKICDCYSMAVRYALIKSQKGKEILKKRIWVEKGNSDMPAYKIMLTVDGKNEVYRVERSDFLGKFFKLFSAYNEIPRGSGNFAQSECENLNLAIDIATSKMISKHPKEKPWYLRLYAWPNNKKCEYNRPSKAFEWLTGIKPESVGEDSIKNNLYKGKDLKEVNNILKKIELNNQEDYSYIIMSGYTDLDLENWHCLPIISVENERVKLKNRRSNNFMEVSYKDLIEKLKSIVGINWKEQK